MKLSRRDIKELERQQPGLFSEDRPKRKRKHRAAGSFPDSLAGIPVGRTIVVKDNEIIWTRKKEA